MNSHVKNTYRHFLRNEDGNIALMAAGAAMPMLALIMGGIELAEFNRIERSMQHAADTAVMAAFDGRELDWSQRIKRADKFFDVNFPYDHRIKKVKRKLSGSQRRRKITLEYSASAQNVNLTGEVQPVCKEPGIRDSPCDLRSRLKPGTKIGIFWKKHRKIIELTTRLHRKCNR